MNYELFFKVTSRHIQNVQNIVNKTVKRVWPDHNHIIEISVPNF